MFRRRRKEKPAGCSICHMYRELPVIETYLDGKYIIKKQNDGTYWVMGPDFKMRFDSLIQAQRSMASFMERDRTCVHTDHCD